MENKINIEPIGKVIIEGEKASIQIDKRYLPALTGLNGFSHLQIIWWGNHFDKQEYRNTMTFQKLIKKGPETLGTFASRSPIRPNPVMLSIIKVNDIDFRKGVIRTPCIDADNNTPVLDIKPYHLMERVNKCKVPEWCTDWPSWYEEAIDFAWKEKMNLK